MNAIGDAVVHGTFTWGLDAPSKYMYAGSPNKYFAYADPACNVLYAGSYGLGFNNSADTVRLAQLTDDGNFGIGCSTAVDARFHVRGGAISRLPQDDEVFIGDGRVYVGKIVRTGQVVTTATQAGAHHGDNGAYSTWFYNGSPAGDIGTGNQVINGGGTGDFALTSRGGSLVFGTATVERMSISGGGNVGIGTSGIGWRPSNRLTIVHPATAAQGANTANDSSLGIELINAAEGRVGLRAEHSVGSMYDGDLVTYCQIWTGTSYIWKERLRVRSDGLVAIGSTSSPGSLEVCGTIRSKEVRVENTGWGDYVFAPDYKLLSLGEVAQHIAQNRHLPGIPSAADIEKNGMGVSDMVSKQMVKIEELTLYAIQAKQERDAMAAKVDHLEAELAEIRALLRAK